MICAFHYIFFLFSPSLSLFLPTMFPVHVWYEEDKKMNTRRSSKRRNNSPAASVGATLPKSPSNRLRSVSPRKSNQTQKNHSLPTPRRGRSAKGETVDAVSLSAREK